MRTERIIPLDTRLCCQLRLHRKKHVGESIGPAPDFGLDPETDLLSLTASQSTALLDGAPFEMFLDYVYLVLLNRRPDPQGISFYDGLLRNGLSRTDVVHRLIRSLEYRHRPLKTGSREAALTAYARAGRIARLPLIGNWLVRPYRERERLERLEANQHRLAAQVDRVRREIAAFLEQDELARFTNDAQAGDPDTMMFRMAFARARRDL